jgi:hypothetical protein
MKRIRRKINEKAIRKKDEKEQQERKKNNQEKFFKKVCEGRKKKCNEEMGIYFYI